MTPRARWKRSWASVRYCSRRCRASRPGRLDAQLEGAIVELLADRSRAATVCPSEAARAVRPEAWRGLMQRSRSAAGRLAARGVVDVWQGSRRVDPSTAKGPIRIGRGPAFQAL